MYRRRSCLLLVLLLALTGHFAAASDPVPSPPGAPLSSSFPGPLWQVVTPVGGTVSVSNAHMFLNVPGGSNHDVLRPSNQAVQAVQPIGDRDFDVSIKIDSQVLAEQVGTSRGLIVLANKTNYITFALVTDGTEISLTAQTVTDGVEATVFNEARFSEYQNPMCLRISRSGSAYLAYYSADGVVWTQAAAFTNSRTPTMVGPFAGNYNSTPAKAIPLVVAINWFDILQ